MRSVVVFVFSSLFAVACAPAADDGSVTDDANELNEGRGALERDINPPLAAPTSPLIGAKLTDVLADLTKDATALAPKKGADDCTKTSFKDATTNKVIVAHIQCETTDVVRLLDEKGAIVAEHSDLNSDGKVDRYTSDTEAVAQYVDTNFDGKIDVIVERVDKLKDFSMKGYDETFPKSKFLFRIREDLNRDGKFEHEKLTARGALPPKDE